MRTTLDLDDDTFTKASTLFPSGTSKRVILQEALLALIKNPRKRNAQQADDVTPAYLLFPFCHPRDAFNVNEEKEKGRRSAQSIGVDWLIAEMGVITLHVGDPLTYASCALSLLDLPVYIHNLWYRHLSGEASPFVSCVSVGGGADLLPSPGKSYPLDLWSHPEARGRDLDPRKERGATPGFRDTFPLRRDNGEICVKIGVTGSPGQHVSFQVYLLVEKIV